jgi:hypothetical protein
VLIDQRLTVSASRTRAPQKRHQRAQARSQGELDTRERQYLFRNPVAASTAQTVSALMDRLVCSAGMKANTINTPTMAATTA